MTDIFQEVEEDLRREEAARLWKRYGVYILAGCVAVVLLAAANVAWQAYRAHRSQAASLTFQDIVHAGEADAPALTADSAKSLAAAAAKMPKGYRLIATLEEAGAYVSAGDYKQAVDIYNTVAADSAVPPDLRDLAELKAAYLQVESMSLSDLRAKIEPLTVPESPFRFSADELIGYSAFRAQDYKTAQEFFATIVNDSSAPESLRRRSLDLLGLTTNRLADAVPVAPPQPAPATSAPAPAKSPTP